MLMHIVVTQGVLQDKIQCKTEDVTVVSDQCLCIQLMGG